MEGSDNSRYETVKNVIKICSEVSSVPRPVNAWLIKDDDNSIKVESKWSVPDLQRRKKVNTARTYFVNHNAEKININRAIHEIPIIYTSFHPEEDIKAVLYIEEEKGEEKQILKIWRKEKQIFCLDVSNSKLHGSIHAGGGERTFQWCGRYLIYLAEPKREVESFFKESVTSPLFKIEDKMFDEFLYQEHWGEAMTSDVHPLLCCLDLHDFKITVKDLLKDMSIGVAVWGPQHSIVFVASDEKPYKLGRVFCLNNKSTLYHCNVMEENPQMNILSEKIKNNHVHSPRFSPNKQCLVYLQNSCHGPHRKCSQLVLCDWKTKQNKILVDIVNNPKDNEFPGIFTAELPERCFTSTGSHVLFSTQWHSTRKIVAVNVATGSVIDVSKDYIASCMIALDVHEDRIIAIAESIHTEPFLVMGIIKVRDGDLNIEWHNLDTDAPRFLNDISFMVKSYIPSLENSRYPGLKCEAIFIRSKTLSSLDHGHPIVIYPHGGPHSAYSLQYLELPIVFAKLGFLVCMVNYRGSIGFGENNINSLPGNIGSQDISDVKDGLKEVKKWMEESGIPSSGEVFIFGGSHGGFITGHLCAQYPGQFKACVMVNPVLDLAGHSSITDIPDWSYAVNDIPFTYQLTSFEDLSVFNSKSVKVKNVVTPTLLLLGQKDHRVPYYQGLNYYRSLKALGVETKLCLYPIDGHGLTGVAAFGDEIVQTVLWFLNHLKNKK